MRSRSPAIFAYHYLDLVARAYAHSVGQPTPPAVKCVFVTLFKPRIGVKVQAWFWRHTPRKIPELRIGINFDAHDARINAIAGPAFAQRFTDDLHALGAEFWPSETNTDRRYMTPLPVPPVGEDLTEVTTRAAELAQRYVELLKKDAEM